MRGQRAGLVQKLKMSKLLSKLQRSLAAKKNKTERALNLALRAAQKSIITPMQSRRSRRSVPQSNNEQVDVFEQFIENSGSEFDGGADTNADDGDDETFQRSKYHLHRNTRQMFRDQEQKQQLQFINSAGNKDYAFDTTDTDQFKEDDDLLRQYYKPARSAAFDDYDSINNLMHSSNDQDSYNSQYMRQLHYGDSDHFMNDANDESDDDDMEVDGYEYDDY